MRVYLDTNIILDWFKYNIKRIRRGENIISTSKLKFLMSKNLELFVSSITKAEIFRYLKSEFNCSEEECVRFWSEFLFRYKLTEMESKEIQVDFGFITKICKQVYLGRKTIINLIHLQLAKKNNLVFLTGDKVI